MTIVCGRGAPVMGRVGSRHVIDASYPGGEARLEPELEGILFGRFTYPLLEKFLEVK